MILVFGVILIYCEKVSFFAWGCFWGKSTKNKGNAFDTKCTKIQA
jgi:hypothetical protein